MDYMRLTVVHNIKQMKRLLKIWKEKERKVDLYSAYRQLTTKRSDADHRVTCKYTTSAFPSRLLLTVSSIQLLIYYSFPIPLRAGG